MPRELVDALSRNEARTRYFATIAAPRAALLVIDMQNHWLSEQGLGFVAHAPGIVPQVNALAAALRAQGGHVAWVRSTFATSGRSAWPMLFEHLEPPELGRRMLEALSPGSAMHGFWPGLAIDDGDLVVDKDRFSALAEGASNLEPELRRRGVDTVIVTGVVTNICCESTARDAMMRDFRTIMVSDATAARSDAEHLAGLVTFAGAFGAVLTAGEVVARLTGTGAAR